jgi:hypothetical protein
MFKIAVLVLVQILATSSCYRQGSEKTAVQDYVMKFLETTQNHAYDKAWIANDTLGDHPDANMSGIAMEYASIPEVIKPHPRVNVVLRSEIVSSEKKLDYVDFVKRPKTKEYAYFVKMKHTIVAETVGEKLKVLDGPEDVFEYLILAQDPTDGMYKYIDSYPSPIARFFGLKYFLANFDFIASRNPGVISPSDKDKLERFAKILE